MAYRPLYTFPITLTKQLDPRINPERAQRLVVLLIIVLVTLTIWSAAIGAAPFSLIGFTSLLVLNIVLGLYLPGYLAYELNDVGVTLRSALRTRTIPYGEIERAIVFADIASLGFGWWGVGYTDYVVGRYSNEHFGSVDVVASHLHDPAVVLILKSGRPLLFTPDDQEWVVEIIESMRKAAQAGRTS